MTWYQTAMQNSESWKKLTSALYYAQTVTGSTTTRNESQKENLQRRKNVLRYTHQTYKESKMGRAMVNLMKGIKTAESPKEEKAEKKLSSKAYAAKEKAEGEKGPFKKPATKAKK